MKNNEMGWACGTYGGRRGAYMVLVRRHEGKRSLGRPRCRWGKYLNGSAGTGMEVWTGLIWLRIGTGDGLFQMQ